MSEWKVCKLGDVVNISTGYSFKGNLYEFSGSLRAVRGENITEGTLRWDSEKFWNHPYDEKYLLETNDIVIGMDGSKVGKNRAKIKEKDLPLILAQRVTRIQATALSNQSFIWYTIYSQNFINYVEAIHTGTSIPHISMKQISDFEILIPALDEQKVIAEVLSSLDDKIDLLHHQNKTLEELAQTLFRQWFIEEANDEWEEVTLGDFVKTNVLTLKKDSSLKTIQYLDTSSLTEGKIDSFQQLDLSEAPSRAKRIVKHNDVLISTVRPNQKHYGIIKNPTEDMIVSTGYCVVSCEQLNPHFIYILLTTDDMTEYLHSIAEGSTSTYPSLKPSDIEAVEFLLPPEDKLKKFSDYADNAWDKIDNNHIQIKTLENMRDTLLPKLMSGEVRVTH